MAELLLLSDGQPVLRCPLHGQTLRVGKSPANDISLPDEDAPPWLCSFESVGGGYDVVARAGQELSVSGRSGLRQRLNDGDVVDLGRLSARYQEGADKAPARTQVAAQRTGILTRTDGGLTRTDLLIAFGDKKPQPVPQGGLRVGANEDNDIVVDDGFVSSFHAQLFLRGERLFVRDLDSTNGTFVGGVKVIEAEVTPGSTMKFGKCEAKVVTKVEPETVPAVSGDGPWQCGDLVTADAKFAKVFRLIEKVATHDATVCVFGETGCGKELVARALHDLSARASQPFVPLNCAAIPATLIESMLFGHEKGAFTGADRMQRGVFEEAHKGTLFLDEIGELPMDMQAKLLRVLETRCVRRLGGKQDMPVDVRVVCATHRDLVKHVKEGHFREDLLHRLYVVPIKLIPLRNRPADVAHLAHHFVEMLRTDETTLDASGEKKLLQHKFPGNVRELKNVIQRALILDEDGVIKADDIDFIPTTLEEKQDAARIYEPGMSLEDIERRAYREIMAVYPSASQAAKALGMSKSTFWRRATALGVLEKKES